MPPSNPSGYDSPLLEDYNETINNKNSEGEMSAPQYDHIMLNMSPSSSSPPQHYQHSGAYIATNDFPIKHEPPSYDVMNTSPYFNNVTPPTTTTNAYNNRTASTISNGNHNNNLTINAKGTAKSSTNNNNTPSINIIKLTNPNIIEPISNLYLGRPHNIYFSSPIELQNGSIPDPNRVYTWCNFTPCLGIVCLIFFILSLILGISLHPLASGPFLMLSIVSLFFYTSQWCRMDWPCCIPKGSPLTFPTAALAANLGRKQPEECRLYDEVEHIKEIHRNDCCSYPVVNRMIDKIVLPIPVIKPTPIRPDDYGDNQEEEKHYHQKQQQPQQQQQENGRFKLGNWMQLLPPLSANIIQRLQKYQQYIPELYYHVQTWDMTLDTSSSSSINSNTNSINKYYIEKYITQLHVQIPIQQFTNISVHPFNWLSQVNNITHTGDVIISGKAFLDVFSNNDIITLQKIKQTLIDKYSMEATYCTISLHLILRDPQRYDWYRKDYDRSGMIKRPTHIDHTIDFQRWQNNLDFYRNGTTRHLKLYQNINKLHKISKIEGMLHPTARYTLSRSEANQYTDPNIKLNNSSDRIGVIAESDSLTTMTAANDNLTVDIPLHAGVVEYLSSNYHPIKPMYYPTQYLSLKYPNEEWIGDELQYKINNQHCTIAEVEPCIPYTISYQHKLFLQQQQQQQEQQQQEQQQQEQQQQQQQYNSYNQLNNNKTSTIKPEYQQYSSIYERQFAMCCTSRLMFIVHYLCCTGWLMIWCFFKRTVYINYPNVYNITLIPYEEWLQKWNATLYSEQEEDMKLITPPQGTTRNNDDILTLANINAVKTALLTKIAKDNNSAK